jgi:hypothetical protein
MSKMKKHPITISIEVEYTELDDNNFIEIFYNGRRIHEGMMLIGNSVESTVKEAIREIFKRTSK